MGAGDAPMTAPNRATLWGRAIVSELAAAGIETVCLAPGSRSTPLTVTFAEHDDIETYSILDERSAAFFALGHARRTGQPAAIVCTSGTAAANFHPAVIEADRSKVPLLVLTADRPAELHDSGANQTVDQERLYGTAVRWSRTLPEPASESRRLRAVRVAAARAVAETTGADPGPVHLNVPVSKPLEPIEVADDIPVDFEERAPLAAQGRSGPFVRTSQGRADIDEGVAADIAADADAADRGLLVVGPRNPNASVRNGILELARALEWPVLADPLSGLRFGPHVTDVPICGGYDGYLGGADAWPDPDVVLRFGASPTSKILRHYLRDATARQVVVDAAGDWPEAEFTATDHVVADPGHTARSLAAAVESSGDPAWQARFLDAEATHWSIVERARTEQFFEGAVLAGVIEGAPDPATVFVSNSMPVRDGDRFGRPREADLTVLGNRGASGIDGITSSALGAGSATAEPLILVAGDLAYYHDMNGLLSVARCGVDATVVLVNNDGGGIFHKLPIEQFDPPFTDQFKTPHGLDFEPTGDLYGLEFERVADADALAAAYAESLDSDGTQVIEVGFDAPASHDFRDTIESRVHDRL